MSLNNLPRKARKSSSNKSWIELLRPIIQDFKEGSNETLSPQEVERLSLIIRFKIDLDEGNLNNIEMYANEIGLLLHQEDLSQEDFIMRKGRSGIMGKIQETLVGNF